jgi:hypothetical protein
VSGSTWPSLRDAEVLCGETLEDRTSGQTMSALASVKRKNFWLPQADLRVLDGRADLAVGVLLCIDVGHNSVAHDPPPFGYFGSAISCPRHAYLVD